MESDPRHDHSETSHPVLHAAPVIAPITQGHISPPTIPPLPDGIEYLDSNTPFLDALFEMAGETLPLTVRDRVEYHGQAAGFLLGTDLDLLTRISKKVKWDWKPLSREEKEGLSVPVLTREVKKGRIKGVFDQAATVVEEEYTVGPQSIIHPLPLRAMAFCTQGTLYLKAPLPWPGQTRNNLQKILKIPMDKIEIMPEAFYQDFDNRIWISSFIGIQAAVLSWITGKEVHLELSSFQEYLYGPKRPPSRFHYKTALDEQGKILGMELDLSLDMGARAFLKQEVLDRTILGALGTYRIKTFQVRANVFCSPSAPNSTLGSMGEDLGNFALELHTMDLANACDQDPMFWKNQNLPSRGVKMATEEILKKELPIARILEELGARSDFSRKFAVQQSHKQIPASLRDKNYLRGIGVSVGFQGNGFLSRHLAKASMSATLESGGILHLYSSLWPRRKAAQSKWRAKAAQILEIPPTQVFFHRITPEIKNDSGLDSASRGFEIMGKLLLQCCRAIAKKRFRDALPITVTKVLRKTPSWDWSGSEFKGIPFHSRSYGGAIVDLRFDPILGTIQPKTVWLAVEAGQIENTSQAKAALKEGVALALEWVLGTGVVRKRGKVVRKAFARRGLLRPQSPPEVEIYFLPSEDKQPQSKGLGYLGAILTAPALVAALRQVFHVPINGLPMGPNFIARILESYEK